MFVTCLVLDSSIRISRIRISRFRFIVVSNWAMIDFCQQYLLSWSVDGVREGGSSIPSLVFSSI